MIEHIQDFCTHLKLSRRESDVVHLLITKTANTAGIAKALKITPNTVNNHFKATFEKTGVRSKTEILRHFIAFVQTKSELPQSA